MAKVWRRLVGWMIAIISAALNWYVFVKIGGWIGATEPEVFATILLLSVALHELGHWVVLESYGVMTHLFFGVVFGGAIPDPKHGAKKMKSLNWHQLAMVAMSGVMANMLICVGSVVLYYTNMLSYDHMLRVLNMNGALVVFNLLPFGGLDGGRFAKAFFDSVPEHEDMPYALRMSAVIFAGSILTLLIVGVNDPVIMGLLVWGLHRKAEQDDPRGSRNNKAMTKQQQRNWAMTYDVIVVSAMVAVSISAKIGL